MSEQNSRDDLEKACAAGNVFACQMLKNKTPMESRGMKMREGGLLADSSRTWRMEATYPEFQKGIANKTVNPTAPKVEETFMYSPLQAGYAEGGEVDNFMDTTGSMLQPEVPLNFEDEVLMEDEMLMEEENGLSPEQEEVLGQAMSDYPELEEILDILESETSTDEFMGDGQVDGPGTETSDSIPAMLSDGEFVFTAKSVKQLGVDKLRKMMSKAEMDYDEGEAKQEYAQMGDEGFAAGGYSLMKRPKYEEGGKIRTKKTGPAGKTYSSREISDIVRQLGIDEEQISTHIVRLGNGRFKIKNLDLSAFGFNDGGPVDRHISRNQAKETLGQKAIRIGMNALRMIDRPRAALGRGVDRAIDTWNTPQHSMADPVGYEIYLKRKKEEDENRARAQAEAELNMRAGTKPSSLLDGKDF